MIDRFLLNFFGNIDNMIDRITKLFESKPRKRKKMKISDNTSVSMPVKNMLMIIAGVIAGVFAYTEIMERLTSLETSRELFQNDLLKKSEQVPVDQEQHFLLEDLYKTVEKMEETQEMNMTNKVNIEFLKIN